jgi:hypothetical protein
LAEIRTRIVKLTILIVALVALGVVVVACKKQAGETTASGACVVAFEGAGVSLVPGVDWKQLGRGSFAGAAPPGVCLPTLAGKSGLVQVLLLPPDRSEPQTAAAGVRAAFDANLRSIKDSYRQESITVQSGAQVIYVSYSQQPEGATPEGRSHNYILKNRAGRGVAINYITNARTDSEVVHQMIRETLRVE